MRNILLQYTLNPHGFPYYLGHVGCTLDGKWTYVQPFREYGEDVIVIPPRGKILVEVNVLGDALPAQLRVFRG